MNSVLFAAKSVAGDNVRKATCVLGAFLGLLLFCSPASAQLNYGRILGAVTDQTGGAVAGASVEVIDVARGLDRTLTTDTDGQYSASSLLPGTYTVRGTATGFKAIERPNITVEVGQDVRVDLTVQPGEQTQTVTVTEAIPVMNTTNAQLGGVLTNQVLADLPLNGREFQKLLILRPGVRANGLDIYVNGNRADNNNWLLDGVGNNNTISSSGPVAGGQSSFDQATILPVDAIQEVNVIQNPKSEYGWKPGGQVNVGLKSGTNAIHGTATAFGHATSLDAKNPFLGTTLAKANDDVEQFGASVGGPIKKDKFFYFAAYEGQRYTVGSPKTVQIPTSAAGAGAASSFPDAIAQLQSLGKVISPLSLNLAGCTLSPSVSCTASAGLFPNSTSSATIPTSVDNIGGSDSGIGKLDYHYNDRNAFNAEYFHGQGGVQQAGNGVQPYWRGGHFTGADVGRVVWVWTPNSTWVNELRGGFEGQTSPQGPWECNNPASGAPNYASSFGFVTGLTLSPPQCGFPTVSISTFTSLGGGNTQLARFKTWSFVDAVSYTRGKHLFKFGGEMHFTNFIGVPGSLSNITGNLAFGKATPFAGATALEDFLLGAADSGAVIVGDPGRNVSYNRYALFVQDDWRLTANVIVNLGVRWEYVPPIADQNSRLGEFNASAQFGLVQQGNQVGSLYSNSKDDFGPRLGIAWDIGGKGTTVVRVGGSLVYNSDQSLKVFLNSGNAGLNFTPTGFALVNANGTTVAAAGSNGSIQTGTVNLTTAQIPWAVNTPIFGSAASATLACGDGLSGHPAPCNVGAIDPNFKRAYVTTWNVSVQHAFTSTLSLNAAYVGTKGTHMGANINLNQPVGVTANEQTGRPYYNQFPWLGNITDYTSFSRSNYNALQTTLTERTGHGLTLTAGYSFSHSLDDSSSETGYTATWSAFPHLDYANSNADPRQNLAITMSYNIPGRKAPAQLLEGWQVNSVVHALGGIPFSAFDTSSDLGGTGAPTQSTWTLLGSPRDFVAGALATIPCYGVTGSKFAAATNCTTVTAVANMPTACITAATNEPTNPAVPSSDKNSTGLKALANWGCYASANGSSAIVPPAQGTFGTMSRSALRAAPFKEWDLSVTKNWKFERVTAQFRVEGFNINNVREFASPSSNISSPGTFGQTQSTPNSSNPIVGEGGPRQIQLGLKLIF